MTDRMYIVTRRDLSPGMQGVQSCHAVELLSWGGHYGEDYDEYMIWVSVENEYELLKLHKHVSCLDLYPSLFKEPDLDGAATAFAVMVPEEFRHLFSHLPSSLGKLPWRVALLHLKVSTINTLSGLFSEFGFWKQALKLKDVSEAIIDKTYKLPGS